MHLYFIILIISSFQSFDRTSFEMVRRVNRLDQTIKSTAAVYFDIDGNMVTRYEPPLSIYVFNNKDGEIKLYNEKDNTVVQSVNYRAGSTNTNFYFFLMGETEDMGLRKLGFVLKNTKIEDGLVISEWNAPFDMRQNFASVELVHQDEVPIFLGHKNHKGEFIDKTYYYDYQLLQNYIMFPTAITEIEYIKDDSVISKTNFLNFQFDNYVDRKYFEFEIPADAKVLK